MNVTLVSALDIQPLTVTENPDEFVRALDRLTVDGGGDCPEMACGGILQALQNAYPYSYLYVFTDAPAKDHHLYKDILGVIQRKHSQVGSVLIEK
jgi:hemicentin